MENHTVVQLKAIAKERGIRGQKGRVDTCLGSGEISRTKSNIFDESIPNDPTPVLQPTPWRPSNIALKNNQNKNNFAAKDMQ